jgi:hypothetical protein
MVFTKVRTAMFGLFAIGMLVVLLSAAVAPQTAHAATALRYVQGFSVQGSWLCYGWSNGKYHCTQQWHWSGGHAISDNPSFVPRLATTSTALSAPVVTSGSVTSGQPCRTTVVWPSSISQWTVPLGCYSKIYYPNPANYPSRPSYGWCNWWPEVLHPWLSGSNALHLPSHGGFAPRPGAVVYFRPYQQGASSAGHYAQVVAVHGSWVLVTEMNFYWRGGGFKRVDYRFIHVSSGIDFRY